MRRKGSRMSMERFERKYEKKPEPSQDSNFDVNNFLKNNQVNIENKNSNGVIKPIKEDSKGEEDESPKSTRSKTDEGLGESFEQQSETSDRGNGGLNSYRNPVYDAVPEEEGMEKEGSQDKGELPLDASKLEDDVTSDGNKRPMSKKVSFLWGEEGNTENSDQTPEPVSERFVYEEQKDKSKFSLRKSKK